MKKVKTCLFTALLSLSFLGLVSCGEGTSNDSSIVNNDISLSQNSADMILGDTLELTASSSTKETIAWTSSDTSVAIVNDGTVLAIGKGVATITASIGENKATCLVNVGYGNYLPSLSLDNVASDSIALGKGTAFPLRGLASFNGKSYPCQLSISVEDKEIVSLSGNSLIGKKVGTTKVIVKGLWNNFSTPLMNKTIDVVVSNDISIYPEVTLANTKGVMNSIDLSLLSSWQGENYDSTANVKFIVKENGISKSASISSTDPEIISVTSDGFVQAKKVGEAKLVGTYVDENGNEYYTKAKFKVYNTPEDAAMSYVNWIKNNCSEEEIKSVHSPSDVARLMKKHGYYTDNEDTYAAGLEARAKNYAGQASMSDEEKEQLEVNREKAAKSEWMKRKQEQQESLARTLDDMKIPMSTMTPQEKESYIDRIAASNPLFADSSQYKSLMANAKAQEKAESARSIAGKGGTGYSTNKMVNNLISLIGTGIVSREDLDNKLELAANNGYALTDAQKDSVESAWNRYEHGDKEFSVELPSAKELADYTGVDSSQFDASTMGLIRQRIYQYSNNQYEMIPNPNGYPASQDVIKRIAQEVVQTKNIYHEDHWLSADEDYNVSMAGLARAGIVDYEPYGNGMFQVIGRNGESFYCSAAQLQDMNDGTKTMMDVMEENGGEE
ncbi:MAG TPA: hypothetical protein DEF61_04875 [Firmicutes bacterium]|nr:hypothetical protein [Bacillota bacterium]